MAVSPRLIRRRIRSVTNTKKITKAMELVSAAKMRRATASALASRRYAHVGWETVRSVLRDIPLTHPLTTPRTGSRLLIILLTSHRALAGGYNANALKKAFTFAREAIEKTEKHATLSWVTVGKKGDDALRRTGAEILAHFDTLGDTPTFAEVAPLATYIRTLYLAGAYDRVYTVYTHYQSALTQTPMIQALLPVSPESIDVFEHLIGPAQRDDTVFEEESTSAAMVFEPDRQTIVDTLIPRMVDTLLYQAVLEASASEHSARMLAMRNATEAAGEMIDDLTLSFNQARQAAITREISEIAAGKAAVAQ